MSYKYACIISYNMPYNAKIMSDANSATPKIPKNVLLSKKKSWHFSDKIWYTYRGTEGSHRKTDARFGFSGSGLPIKPHL